MRRRDLGAASTQERPAVEQALDEISAEEQGVIARQDENATTSDEKIVGNEKKKE